MKEAAGEANLTVVAIVLIGIVVAIATPLIGSLLDKTSTASCCTADGGIYKDGSCSNGVTYDEKCNPIGGTGAGA